MKPILGMAAPGAEGISLRWRLLYERQRGAREPQLELLASVLLQRTSKFNRAAAPEEKDSFEDGLSNVENKCLQEKRMGRYLGRRRRHAPQILDAKDRRG